MASTKGKAGAEAPALSGIDFSEIEYYIDRLEENVAHPERRGQLADVLKDLAAPLKPVWASGQFILAVSGVEAWGGSVAQVREAFLQLSIYNAGAFAAMAIAEEQRVISQQHGSTGGRPTNEERAAKWFASFIKAKGKALTLEPQEIYEDIAAAWNAKKGRAPVKWKTVRKEIGKHRKRLK